MLDMAIRPYDDADLEPVLALLAASLGKTVDDRYRGFFRWKHLESPFGRSFMWVAEVEGRLAGFRSFLRWRFLDPGGDPVEAVRAVDTATHPDFRGMGVFKKLTMHGLDEMRPQGIQFVFNTPNDQSRPGYLKMGWTIDGRVPMRIRPRSLTSAPRILRARTAADQWSLPATCGVDMAEVDAARLTEATPVPGFLVTHASEAFLRWRYGGCAAVASRGAAFASGLLVFRSRRRGAAIECTVGDVIGSPASSASGKALREVLAETGADYAIATASSPISGTVRSARLGPVQTRRAVSANAPALPLQLTLGDVELF